MNIYNLIILDESGSMCTIEKQAISSMNETIQSIKTAQTEHPDMKQFISLISFSGSGLEGVKVIIDKKPAAEVSEISEEDYRPNSCTPLYDAMGFALTNLQKTVEKGDRVLVTIITDGMENTSQVFSGSQVSKMVRHLRSIGWTFVYIGANQDAVEVAKELCITNALNFLATESGTRIALEKERKCRKAYYDRARNEERPFSIDDFFTEED